MPVEVAVALIGLIEAIGVAVIGAIVQFNKKKDEAYRAKREKDEEARTELIACMYDLTFASATGTEVLLHQAHGDRINGNVDSALESIDRAKSKCTHLLNKNAAGL